MTLAQVAAVTEEIGARAGDRVRAVHQDSPHRFRVALEGSAGRADLVLDLDLEFPRLHLADAQPAPAAPSPLAASMRNALVGARLEGARRVAGERAVEVRFALAGLPRALWYEGFGRRANLYLLDEAGRVLATPRGEVAEVRGASVGAAFAPVPPREEPESQEPADEDAPEATGSAEVERAAAEASTARDLERTRSRLAKALRGAEKKAARLVEVLEAALAAEGDADVWARRGELLRGSFPLLRHGADRVRVPDWTKDPPEEVEVPLDPSLEPGEQVAACFRAAEKARRAAEEARARLPAARAEAERARAAAARLDAATDEAALLALAREARVQVPREPSARKGPQRAAPWRTYVSADGWTILVGKTAEGNDRLTTREARPWDLFVHVRGSSGSHVIVRTPQGKTVPKETLLDAAELACLHSGRREADRNEVDYAERRHVRKPRGAPAGLVELERAKTLAVRRDDDRRRRLREAAEPGSEPE